MMDTLTNNAVSTKGSKPAANRMKKSTTNTVFFRYAPSNSSITRRHFETYFSDIGPVKKCSLIRSGQNDTGREAKGYGFCKFTCQEDAIEAANTLNESKMKVEGGLQAKVWVEVADSSTSQNSTEKKKRKDIEPVASPSKSEVPKEAASANDNAQANEEYLLLQAKKRTSRVILRNLSFYATEYNIKKEMEDKFGEVVDINLPLVPTIESDDNDNRGGKKYKKQTQHRGFAFVTFANQKSAHNAVEACASSETQVIIKKRPVAIDFSVSKFQHRRMMEEEKAGNDQDKEDEEMSSNETDDDENEEASGDEERSGSDSDKDGSDDSDDSDDETSSSDEESEDETESAGNEEKAKPKNSHQHSLFLRNLPFDTTRHDLFTIFSKYGRIGGIYIVKDHNTGLAKGTAFIQYEKEGGCARALEASNTSKASTDINDFQTGKSMISSFDNSSGGVYLHGRRILVDRAVDKNTADTLKVQRDEDGKPIDKRLGKDKRNLYLKGEGRVEEGGKEASDINSWENLPQSDQMKRGRAHQEKSTKLRSPLFFINPFRLSFRNLSKEVDETQLKHLAAMGIEKGLENALVSNEDVVAHWKASGEMTAREIIEKLRSAESDENDSIVPTYNESDGFKKYIPSVFIDRDFQGNEKSTKVTAPSRGFGFVEFTHHAHALACLRELNNNSTYSTEFVAGGKKATSMKKSNRKKKRKDVDSSANDDDNFMGDDGKVRIPRVIVEFTVENKAKARKQAERKAQQLANVMKQKAVAKQSVDESGEKVKKKKKKSRGMKQREKKRKIKEEGTEEEQEGNVGDNGEANDKIIKKQDMLEKPTLTRPKGVKPPKKKKKVDKDENNFEDMVKSYKKAFADTDTSTEVEGKETNARSDISKNRWFD
jgi:nucleolar protein 4